MIISSAQVSWLMAQYIARGIVIKTFVQPREQRLDLFVKGVSRYSAKALEKMNVEIKTIGLDRGRFERENYLLVCNHMSYIDVLITSTVLPSVFVTSVDMGEAFFLGDMAELGGSIFIERRHRGQVEKDLTVMSDTLKSGFNVIIYPEGTSTDGSGVLPFKKSLLMSAVHAGKKVQPVCLRYKEINGEPFSVQNRDKICWYGDMTFVPHFLSALSLKSVKVELEFLEPISTTPETTRDELASQCFTAVSAAYGRPFENQ